MEKIKEFVAENRLILAIGLCLLLLICWLHADQHRNDGIRDNTDSTMADIDKRVQSIEGRLDSMQDRLDENQKAVTGIAERIEDLIREIEKANR